MEEQTSSLRAPGKSGYKKFGVALGLLLLVLLTVTLLMNRDRLTFSHLSRAIAYRNLGSSIAEEYHFSGLGSNTFVTFDNGLAVASGSGLAVYNRRGEQVYAGLALMEQPVLTTAGDFILAFDLGGRDLQIGNTQEAIRQFEADGRIIDARINENGWVTVSSEQIGTLGFVRVYDPQGRPRLNLRSRDGHLIAAALAADNRTLVTLSMNEDGGRVAWFYIDVEGEHVQHEHIEPGEVFFDFWFTSTNGAVGAISGNMVRYLSNTGVRQGEYRFHDRHLRAYDVDAPNVALHISPHLTGAGGELVRVEPEGMVHSTLVEGNLFDISLRGRYIAALFFDRLVVYRNGRVYATFRDTEGMNRVLMREDGTVFRLSSHRARLLVP
ncbi:MAG: DUF5711 family protein [Oscillospiraceae bacterium]|nr:DUF5711 family protein [Oscillospiraceae bacterium]